MTNSLYVEPDENATPKPCSSCGVPCTCGAVDYEASPLEVALGAAKRAAIEASRIFDAQLQLHGRDPTKRLMLEALEAAETKALLEVQAASLRYQLMPAPDKTFTPWANLNDERRHAATADAMDAAFDLGWHLHLEKYTGKLPSREIAVDEETGEPINPETGEALVLLNRDNTPNRDAVQQIFDNEIVKDDNGIILDDYRNNLLLMLATGAKSNVLALRVPAIVYARKLELFAIKHGKPLLIPTLYSEGFYYFLFKYPTNLKVIQKNIKIKFDDVEDIKHADPEIEAALKASRAALPDEVGEKIEILGEGQQLLLPPTYGYWCDKDGNDSCRWVDEDGGKDEEKDGTFVDFEITVAPEISEMEPWLQEQCSLPIWSVPCCSVDEAKEALEIKQGEAQQAAERKQREEDRKKWWQKTANWVTLLKVATTGEEKKFVMEHVILGTTPLHIDDELAKKYLKYHEEHKEQREKKHKEQLKVDAITIDDFIAFLPQHVFIYTPTREPWPAISVNARIAPIPQYNLDGTPKMGPETTDKKGNVKPGKQIKMQASTWLDKNHAAQQMTWCPGMPMEVHDRLTDSGGWIEREGNTTFNLYRPPTIVHGDAASVQPWIDHIRKVYPKDAEHILNWMAHRMQHPQIKINHALLLGGGQGIGKDTLLEPLKRAIGAWNFKEVSPSAMMERFNGLSCTRFC